MYIFDLQRRCVVRPRISLEETTPLHKQHNCGGVRASVASTSLGKNGRESERERERERERRKEKERIAFITIVTKRLHSSRERNQRKRKFPRRSVYICLASLSLSLSGSKYECEDTFTHVRVPHIHDNLWFSRGAQIWEHVHPYRTCSRTARCSFRLRILTTV